MNEQDTDIHELSGKTPEFRTQLAKQLEDLVPEAIADGKVDVLKLKELLDEDAGDTNERFGLFWPGKKRAMRAAQDPTTATLKPAKELSQDWDTTGNIFIEGDNLEVLKVLQKQYHNSIKMIYIDPPYNTGKDFVYPDNFKEGLQNYLEFSKQVDEGNKKISTNTETAGRYHSNWLNMMYPRLKLARNLLTDDGVIFISIGDSEQSNLKRICDEVFGESNFIAQFSWIYTGKEINLNQSGEVGSLGTNLGSLKKSHEYVLCYGRSAVKMNLLPTDSPIAIDRVTKSGNKISKVVFPAGLKAESKISRTFRGTIGGESEPLRIINQEGMIFVDGILQNNVELESCFSVKGFLDKYFKSEEVYDKRGNRILDVIFSNTGLPKIVKEKNGVVPSTILSGYGDTSSAEAVLIDLFDSGDFFDYPKPVELIKRILTLATDEESLVLDFFSGSSTTAHAVMQLNAEDGGNRKHIQVQLPEPTDEKSEAYKAGYRKISDIARERINRAGEKIKTDYADKLAERDTPLDVGYRTYRLSDTNFTKWKSEATNDLGDLQMRLDAMRSSSDDNASEEDLLVEVMLKLGLPLTSRTIEREVSGLTVHQVVASVDLDDSDTQPVFYLNEHIKPTLEQLRAIVTELTPSRFVILDDAFQGDSQLKTNLVQTCKSYDVELWTV